MTVDFYNNVGAIPLRQITFNLIKHAKRYIIQLQKRIIFVRGSPDG